MILALAALQAIAETPAAEPERAPFTPPVSELDHPRYIDDLGNPVAWRDVKALTKGTDARRKVQSRRFGRTLLRIGFAGATALEVWGGVKLSQSDSSTSRTLAVPLFIQAGFTGTCAILSWTRLPGDHREDRAILVNEVNSNRVR